MNLDKKYIDKFLKIMELSIKKNIPGKRDIFINFYGNIGVFNIRIYKNGWNENKIEDFRDDGICLDDRFIVDEEHKKYLDEKLDNIIKIVEEL